MKRTVQGLVLVLSLLVLFLGPSRSVGILSPTTARAGAMAGLPAGAPVAAVYQPLNEHLEVFVVDSNGALNVLWKAQNLAWNAPFPLTGADFAKPGASVAALYYPTNQNLEVFVVDKNGVLSVIWKEHDGAWHAPFGLTGAGFAPPGAPLAAVYQPLNEHLEVFAVDSNGALNDIWKGQTGAWNSPFPLTPAGLIKPGASLSAVYYPMNENLEVFFVDKNGVFGVAWKEHDGAWKGPVGLSSAGVFPPGAPLAAVYQPVNEQLEVFAVDRNGVLSDIWKAQNLAWNAPFPLTGADFVKPGASVAAVYYPTNEQLEVLAVDKNSVIAVAWKAHNGGWHAPVGITEHRFVPGASLAAVAYPLNTTLEAFTTDRTGILSVEWKAQNKAWVPCSFPLMGTPPPVAPGPVTVPTVVRTERLGQLTGNTDPQGLQSSTDGEWSYGGVEGVDMGASTLMPDGRTYIFFGDVVPGNGNPMPGNPAGYAARDTDLVGWTDDSTLQPGGFTLHPVKDAEGKVFYPFSVADGYIDGDVGTLPRDRTPTGAFYYRGRVYVFAVWSDPKRDHDPGKDPFPTTILASKVDPSQPGNYHMEFTFSEWKFWGVQPVVVRNEEHPGLPSRYGDGLVILAGGAFNEVYLAWMRLDADAGPVLSSVRYYTGNPDQPWTPSAEDDPATKYDSAALRDWKIATRHEPEAKSVIHLPPYFSSTSAAWLADAKQWIVLYNKGVLEGEPTADRPNPHNFPAGPIVARFGPNPWTWSDEVEVFNTCREAAYGNFMHWGGLDDINHRVPAEMGDDLPGWAYGAFFLQRFTSWNAVSRELSLAYLMSTSRPYQVQVMRTQLRLPPPPPPSDGAKLDPVRRPRPDEVVEIFTPPGNATIRILSPIGTELHGAEMDAPFPLAGSGFTPGTVSIYLDSPTGLLLGTATVGADGTFRQDFTIDASHLGQHTLVAVQNGIVQAEDAVTVSRPVVVR